MLWTVYMKKFDGRLHYEWTSRLVEQTDDLLIMYASPGRTLRHHTRAAVYTYASHSLECFLLNEGFTAQLEYETGGTMRYYCNIGLVPVLEQNTIQFIDLDIDLISGRIGEWTVIDEDEFEINRIRYGYPTDVVMHVWRTVDEVKRRIAAKQFPFDGSLERRMLTSIKEDV